MKSIDTLVKDIYGLFDPLVEVDLNDKEIDEHLDSFTKSVKETLRMFLKEKPTQKRNLRLSAIGKPTRQLWYDKHSKDEPKPLEPSTRIKFLYGHLLEDLLILFCRLAGHTVTDQQKQIDVNGIKGHQDCMIDGVLVDCKSASGRSFEKFSKRTLYSDDPFGYIAQISAYAEGNGVDEAAFLAIDKHHGDICLPDGASGNRKLAIGCLYCSHKRTCWSDANQGKGLRVFQYAKGYRFLTNVAKEPNVDEVLEW